MPTLCTLILWTAVAIASAGLAVGGYLALDEIEFRRRRACATRARAAQGRERAHAD